MCDKKKFMLVKTFKGKTFCHGDWVLNEKLYLGIDGWVHEWHSGQLSTSTMDSIDQVQFI